MKKIFVFCVLYSLSWVAYSQTCPLVKDIVQVKEDGRFNLVVPEGWVLVEDKRFHLEHTYYFHRTNWGKKDLSADNVKCYYDSYSQRGRIILKTQELVDQSRIPESWKKNVGNPFGVCFSYISADVNECTFG